MCVCIPEPTWPPFLPPEIQHYCTSWVGLQPGPSLHHSLTRIRVTDIISGRMEMRVLVASGQKGLTGSSVKAKQKNWWEGGVGETLTCMMLLRRGWRLLRYSFFTSISLRIFSLLDRHSRYFSASLFRKDSTITRCSPGIS